MNIFLQKAEEVKTFAAKKKQIQMMEKKKTYFDHLKNDS